MMPQEIRREAPLGGRSAADGHAAMAPQAMDEAAASARAIVVDQLVREFGGKYPVRAVDGVSFAVSEGEIFGFLGPNGAGKSTTTQMLTTLLKPTSGHAAVGGFDVVRQAGQVRRIAGVALQDVGIDDMMTAYELLRLQARLFGAGAREAKRRASALLDLVGLADAADRRTGTYSGGMRRRLDLAVALVHEPRILFLDEPTTGLDPISRAEVWTEIRRLNVERGVTVFLTTQYLDEADKLAGRLAIMNAGRIVAEGTPAELKAAIGADAVRLTFADAAAAEQARQALAPIAESITVEHAAQTRGAAAEGGPEQARAGVVGMTAYIRQAAQTIPDVVRRLDSVGASPQALTVTPPSLDDVFLRATGSRLVEGAAAPDQPQGQQRQSASRRK